LPKDIEDVFPETSCTSLVLWGGHLGSTLGLSKITNFIRQTTYIPDYYLGIMTGILLGDASIKRSAPHRNARISFTQSFRVNFYYFWFVFSNLSHYCSSLPYLDKAKINGKIHFSMRFFTRQYPCLSALWALWVTDGVSVIPSDIFNLLTPTAVGRWFMCDGNRGSGGGLYLCTDDYTVIDVVRLINVLLVRYNIPSDLRFINGKPRIYIKKKDVIRVRLIVEPFIIPSMKYKLGT